MRQKQADPSASTAPDVRPVGRFSLRNRRLPTKLVVTLLIPVVLALTFGALRVQSSYTTWQSASDAEKTARLVGAATDVTQSLDQERDLSVEPLVTGQGVTPAVQALRTATDASIAAFNTLAASAPNTGHLQARLKLATQQLANLKQLRNATYDAPGVVTEEGYSSLLSAMQALDNELGYAGGGSNGAGANITSDARSIYAITLAKDAVSVNRSIGMHLLLQKNVPMTSSGRQTQVVRVFGYLFLQNVAQEEFTSAADPAIVQELQAALATATQQGQAAVQQAAAQAKAAGQSFTPPPDIPTMVNDISAEMTPKQLEAAGVTPANWMAANTLEFNAIRAVEKNLTAQAVQHSADAANSARTGMILDAAITLAALLLAALVTTVVARSMIQGMRTLRDSAQEIASTRLPDLVQRLSKTDPDRVDTTVRPIPIDGRDEIGEVARAFDDVHREAIRLASEQAMLRGNVNAIFTNLSRRSQGLIERQLGLITELENNEADPDQLENLFKLDHLATRMRRNGENLLVLAGESAGREWNDPIPLVDVLRAAASEVEQYERIELSGIPETDVVGPAVTDIVHLLAELLENATTFSSPQTRVRVTATRLPDHRVLIEIHDKGIGLTAEDFAGINNKLADPPTVDASVSRQMGLFVVGRLAEKHGIRVQLRPSGESAGTTSLVMVPDHLTQLPRPAEPEEQFTVSRIYGEPEPGAFGGPDGARSASELGFDDSRYDRQLTGQEPAAAAGLGRSPRLEQRRGPVAPALETGPQAVPAAPEPQQPAAQAYNAGAYAPEPYTEQPAAQAYHAEGYPETGYQQAPPTPDYGADFDRNFGLPYAAAAEYQTGSQTGGQAGGQGGAQAPGRPAGAGRDFDGFDGFNSSTPSYPAPDASYEAGRYTAAHFESADPGYGRPQDPYQPEQQYGHPYYAEEPQSAAPVAEQPVAFQPHTPPALPQRPTPVPSPGANGSGGSGSGSALPQRRPGQALGGRAIGDRAAGERPNWFTGAREDEGEQAPAFPPATPFAAPPASGPLVGDTTAAGLPRRIPRQNLLPGNVQEVGGTQQTAAAPQLSRSPEEVRGRLTNLRRGIQQGHSVGDTPSPDQHGSTDLFGGPNHPER
ncbi:nitrate- and nitrite sensing domain-containing protein [Streptacidiphilus sp. EB129]|uniref:sensor histidine kinase n=1 Tax=Streptacidiphilus sp. EB129 TaxID=3156262 RepID=UPI003514DAAE